MGSRPRGTVALATQLAEYGIALLLAWSALHTGSGGEVLLGAAVILMAWAATHDAPLSWIHLFGRRAHRAGLLVGAVSVLCLPIATHRVGQLGVSAPLWLAGLALSQLALVGGPSRAGRRRAELNQAPTARSPIRAEPSGGGGGGGQTASGHPSSGARRAGYVAGSAATLARQQAKRNLPIGARKAGRLLGGLGTRRHDP